jgi:hypothetical protein
MCRRSREIFRLFEQYDRQEFYYQPVLSVNQCCVFLSPGQTTLRISSHRCNATCDRSINNNWYLSFFERITCKREWVREREIDIRSVQVHCYSNHIKQFNMSTSYLSFSLSRTRTIGSRVEQVETRVLLSVNHQQVVIWLVLFGHIFI